MSRPYNLSVVIPVYNRPDDLTRALTSLRNQSKTDFEVIVVDDGSTVDISQVVEANKDLLHLKYIRIDNSGGPARPRNIGIREATGEWISLLDSDDWWDSNRVAVVCRAIQNSPDTDVFYHKLRIVSDNRYNKWWMNKIIGHRILGDPFISLLIRGNALPNSSVVFQRRCFELFNGFNETPDFASVEDFDFWLTLAQNGFKFKFIDKVLGCYWLSATGISSNAERSLVRNRTILEKYLPSLAKDCQKRAESKYAYFAGSVLYASGDLRRAFIFFKSARHLDGLILKFKRLWKMARILFGLR